MTIRKDRELKVGHGWAAGGRSTAAPAVVEAAKGGGRWMEREMVGL